MDKEKHQSSVVNLVTAGFEPIAECIGIANLVSQSPSVMLCYMVICKAPLTGDYSEALSA